MGSSHQLSVREVDPAAILLTGNNPRTDGATELEGLTASLAAGLAQPPVVAEVRPGVYELLVGERRVRSACEAGLPRLAVLVRPAPTPIEAATLRLVENLHRRDLRPLDEARALKLGWLCANATAVGLVEPANTVLTTAGSVRAALAPLTELLEEAGWSSSRPAVTQEQYLAALGLGLSAAALRKKLQLLALSKEAQDRLEQLGLTEAALRAFMRLSGDEQLVLLDALDADPSLARQVRTIVDGVRKKNRSIADAVAIARGQVPGAATDLTPGVKDSASFLDQAGGRTSGDVLEEEVDARSDAAEQQRAADLVLPLLETAQLLAQQLGGLSPAALAELPEPWDVFGQEALVLVRSALRPFEEE
ncbi:MAG TPA: ParB/RepB/Spo0J family partition protein [Roseiflexaceae bacterium]|nr:ParB/RepB/Spo0J family partition protein [Roseiflexaceae bacterium]